jgi:tetratricopeptide (TPR) repeat protein
MFERRKIDGASAGDMARYCGAMSRRELGIAALSRGDFAQAEEHLRAAAAVLGSSADLSAYLAALYARSSRHELCLRECDAAPGADTPAGVRRRSQAQWRSGRRALALMTLTDGLRASPNDAGLHRQLGVMYAAQGDYPRAAQHLQQAARLSPDDPDVHRQLGLLAAARKAPLEAVRHLQRALELRPQDVVLAHHLALAALAASHQGKSVSLRLAPLAAACHSAGVQSLCRYVEAEPDFVEAMLDLPPSDTGAQVLALLWDVVGAVLRRHPDWPDMHLLASRLAQRLSRHEDAMRHAQQAVAHNGRFARALVHLGRLWAASADGDAHARTQAQHTLARAVEAGADWPDVHCLLGQLLQAHDAARAARHFQRALQLNPRYQPAAKGLLSTAA